ncbi:MAG: cytochrome c [Sideroxyarcus sp.]|nr:cytochrome c [Sideroxyarcus sp.]
MARKTTVPNPNLPQEQCAKLRWWVFAIAGLLLLSVAYVVWRLNIDHAERFTDPEMQFKYGSTGGDRNFGIPVAVWQALPLLFKDKLPKGREDEGWAAFGFIVEDRNAHPEMPRDGRAAGTSVRNYQGIERIFLNCGGCHVGSVRATVDSKPIIISGMPANTVDLEGFQNFLIAAALDERFTPEHILAQIKFSDIELDWFNWLALRVIGIYQIRERILTIRNRFRFTNYEPCFGPGRFDTFSPAKALLNWPLDDLDPKERIGVVDFPSIWLQGKKKGMQLHWDGNNTSVEERNRSAAFGTGATPTTLDSESILRIEDWLLTEPPPLMEEILGIRMDEAKVEGGKKIYAAVCANCHGVSGREFRASKNQVGEVTSIDRIGTDRFRFDNYTYVLSLAQNQLYAENPEERFQHFRKTGGYANMPLDGLWLRAPFLHNGSVPTLRDLLEKASDRPEIFYRGCDIYNAVDVGFRSSGPDKDCKFPFKFNTNEDGNRKDGHEYGTWLDDKQKNDLIEYLKTF